MKLDNNRGPILHALRKLWDLHPELRFNQLITYVVGDKDTFYMEDREFLNKIQNKLDNELPVETTFNF